jgi:hypothetical protein
MQLAGVTASLIVASFALRMFGLDPAVTQYSLVAVIFYALLTLVSLTLLDRALKARKPARFINALMLNFVIRLASSACMAAILVLTVDLQPAVMLIPLAAGYLIYSVLDTLWLLRLNRPGSGSA